MKTAKSRTKTKRAEPKQAAHTPGSWEVGEYCHPDGRQYGLERGIFTVQGHIKIAVCEQWIGEECEQEAEANARLIAAAPELLAACRMMLAQMNTFEHAADDAGVIDLWETIMEDSRAAIAKATGGAA